jgi:hypothetical protein
MFIGSGAERTFETVPCSVIATFGGEASTESEGKRRNLPQRWKVRRFFVCSELIKSPKRYRNGAAIGN